MTALVLLCSWCIRDGVVEDVPDASHGICAAHRAQMMEEHAIPRLHSVIARLGGTSYLGDFDRQELAKDLHQVIRLLSVRRSAPSRAPAENNPHGGGA